MMTINKLCSDVEKWSFRVTEKIDLLTQRVEHIEKYIVTMHVRPLPC